MGCVLQAALGQNVARQATLNAGLPIETPAVTLNVVCGSGLNSVNMAADMILAGDADVVIAGGGLAGYYFNAAGGKENADLNSTPLLSASNPFETAQTAVPMNTGGVTAGDIYALGCTQVVGITTEITTTNFFGMTSSVPISGSGFVITENGYILTNYHVIENAYLGGYEISVMLYDGNEYTAEIVGHDADNDIAVFILSAGRGNRTGRILKLRWMPRR